MFRPPVAGLVVITRGKVKKRPPSSGQHFRMGRQSRSGSSETSWLGTRPRTRRVRMFASSRSGRPLRPDAPGSGRVGALHQPQQHLADLAGMPAERHLDAAVRAEDIDGQGEVGPLHPLEQQGWAPLPHHPGGNLGDLELRVHLDPDAAELAVPLQVAQEALEVGERAVSHQLSTLRNGERRGDLFIKQHLNQHWTCSMNQLLGSGLGGRSSC